jgi:hypothetical protein
MLDESLGRAGGETDALIAAGSETEDQYVVTNVRPIATQNRRFAMP